MTPQERAKKQAEVMLAYANGAEIECNAHGVWVTCQQEPFWNWTKVDYRVKKPAPKVVKLWAYVGPSGQIERRFEGLVLSNWKRVPQFDLEYTEES